MVIGAFRRVVSKPQHAEIKMLKPICLFRCKKNIYIVTAAIRAREFADAHFAVAMCFLVIKYAALNHAFLEISCHAGKVCFCVF